MSYLPITCLCVVNFALRLEFRCLRIGKLSTAFVTRHYLEPSLTFVKVCTTFV